MCLSCGCDLPYESYGDPRNITVDTIKEATSPVVANGQNADEIVKNIVKTWKKVKDSDKNYRSSDRIRRLLTRERSSK
jgi:cysteinyl-tRNA synthetase